MRKFRTSPSVGAPGVVSLSPVQAGSPGRHWRSGKECSVLGIALETGAERRNGGHPGAPLACVDMSVSSPHVPWPCSVPPRCEAAAVLDRLHCRHVLLSPRAKTVVWRGGCLFIRPINWRGGEGGPRRPCSPRESAADPRRRGDWPTSLHPVRRNDSTQREAQTRFISSHLSATESFVGAGIRHQQPGNSLAAPGYSVDDMSG